MRREAAGIYRSESGKIWQVIESDEGALSVQILVEGAWVPGPVGMVGLRLASGTTRLTQAAADSLVR